MLVELGANKEAKAADGATPHEALHEEAFNGLVEAMEALVALGVNKDVKAANGGVQGAGGGDGGGGDGAGAGRCQTSDERVRMDATARGDPSVPNRPRRVPCVARSSKGPRARI